MGPVAHFVTITGRPYHFREDGHEKTSSVIFSLLLIRVGQLVDQLTAIIYDFNNVAAA